MCVYTSPHRCVMCVYTSPHRCVALRLQMTQCGHIQSALLSLHGTSHVAIGLQHSSLHCPLLEQILRGLGLYKGKWKAFSYFLLRHSELKCGELQYFLKNDIQPKWSVFLWTPLPPIFFCTSLIFGPYKKVYLPAKKKGLWTSSKKTFWTKNLLGDLPQINFCLTLQKKFGLLKKEEKKKSLFPTAFFFRLVPNKKMFRPQKKNWSTSQFFWGLLKKYGHFNLFFNLQNNIFSSLDHYINFFFLFMAMVILFAIAKRFSVSHMRDFVVHSWKKRISLLFFKDRGHFVGWQ